MGENRNMPNRVRDRFGGNGSNGFGRARMPSTQPFDADKNVHTTWNSRRKCHVPAGRRSVLARLRIVPIWDLMAI
jgi:hypothetical protein